MIYLNIYKCGCQEVSLNVAEVPIACPGHGDRVIVHRATDGAELRPEARLGGHICGWRTCPEPV